MNAGVRGWRAWLAAHLASLPVTWTVDTYELQHQSPSHHLINSFTFTQQSSSHFKPFWLVWRRCFMSVLEWKVIYEAQHASLIVIKRLDGYLFFFPLSSGWLKPLVWWRILPDPATARLTAKRGVRCRRGHTRALLSFVFTPVQAQPAAGKTSANYGPRAAFAASAVNAVWCDWPRVWETPSFSLFFAILFIILFVMSAFYTDTKWRFSMMDGWLDGWWI